MTPATYRSLRLAMRPILFGQRHQSQSGAAHLLGLGRRTIQRIESGYYGDPIPVKFANMILGHGANTI